MSYWLILSFYSVNNSNNHKKAGNASGLINDNTARYFFNPSICLEELIMV